MHSSWLQTKKVQYAYFFAKNLVGGDSLLANFGFPVTQIKTLRVIQVQTRCKMSIYMMPT